MSPDDSPDEPAWGDLADWIASLTLGGARISDWNAVLVATVGAPE
jgi:hypothetical protein